MSDQAHFWSRIAPDYEKEFIDPYRRDVRNPLLRALKRVPDARTKTVADLGCGKGPLLPLLSERFGKVWAVDFADGMLHEARAHAADLDNVGFLQSSLTDLHDLAGKVDVAVAVNSLVLPDARELDEALRQVHACLRPGGRLFGIVPAMDAVHYYTMLLVDRALASGKPLDAARKNAAHFADHADFDFAFNEFCFRGLEQHFWFPFEVHHRLRQAGFRRVRVKRVWLSWKQFTHFEDLKRHPPPWDWFFSACRR